VGWWIVLWFVMGVRVMGWGIVGLIVWRRRICLGRRRGGRGRRAGRGVVGLIKLVGGRLFGNGNGGLGGKGKDRMGVSYVGRLCTYFIPDK